MRSLTRLHQRALEHTYVYRKSGIYRHLGILTPLHATRPSYMMIWSHRLLLHIIQIYNVPYKTGSLNIALRVPHHHKKNSYVAASLAPFSAMARLSMLVYVTCSSLGTKTLRQKCMRVMCLGIISWFDRYTCVCLHSICVYFAASCTLINRLPQKSIYASVRSARTRYTIA